MNGWVGWALQLTKQTLMCAGHLLVMHAGELFAEMVGSAW